MLWSCPTIGCSKPALVFLSIALPESYYLRDRETLSLMLGPCSPKRVESQWTSLAGSTREMGRHGATVTMATGSKNYSEVGDIKRWKGSNR